MKIRTYQTNKAFNQDFDWLTKKYEVETQMIFFNTKDVSRILGPRESRGVVLDESNQPCLVFLDAYPFRMQLFGIDNSLEATQCLIDYLFKNNIQITGILGAKEDTDLFNEVYNQMNHQPQLKPGMSMDIMTLTKTLDFKHLGSIIHPKEKHRGFIRHCIDAFYQEALHEQATDDVLNQKTDRFITSEYTYIFTNELDEPTSIVKAIPFKHGARINTVYTIKSQRNKRYGKSMMGLLCKKLLADENVYYVSLFVDKTNPISNKIYKDIGFRVIRDQYEYTLDEGEEYEHVK